MRNFFHKSAIISFSLYCISGQWPVISDRLYNWHAEIRKSETYIHGGAVNPGHVRLTLTS